MYTCDPIENTSATTPYCTTLDIDFAENYVSTLFSISPSTRVKGGLLCLCRSVHTLQMAPSSTMGAISVTKKVC